MKNIGVASKPSTRSPHSLLTDGENGPLIRSAPLRAQPVLGGLRQRAHDLDVVDGVERAELRMEAPTGVDRRAYRSARMMRPTHWPSRRARNSCASTSLKCGLSLWRVERSSARRRATARSPSRRHRAVAAACRRSGKRKGPSTGRISIRAMMHRVLASEAGIRRERACESERGYRTRTREPHRRRAIAGGDDLMRLAGDRRQVAQRLDDAADFLFACGWRRGRSAAAAGPSARRSARSAAHR